jgi:hypothetical protein
MLSPFNDLQHLQKGGLDEIETFAKRVLEALIRLEKSRQAEPLSIESLVRIDIGLVYREDGRMDYYVNEVSRAPTCSLMQHLEVDANGLEAMAKSVKQGLISMYKHHCIKYPALPRRTVAVEL